MVELVDTRDLKSLDGNIVPVRFRLWAPIKINKLADKIESASLFLYSKADLNSICSHYIPTFKKLAVPRKPLLSLVRYLLNSAAATSLLDATERTHASGGVNGKVIAAATFSMGDFPPPFSLPLYPSLPQAKQKFPAALPPLWVLPGPSQGNGSAHPALFSGVAEKVRGKMEKHSGRFRSALP